VSRGDRGSALVEALIAAAIIMLALGTMYQSISDSAMRARTGWDRSMALLVAQSAQATVGSLIPLEPGETTGSEGPYEWSVDIEPADTGEDANGVGLMTVTTRVDQREKRGALVTLHTLRFSHAP
jgi:hypothetical protein